MKLGEGGLPAAPEKRSARICTNFGSVTRGLKNHRRFLSGSRRCCCTCFDWPRSAMGTARSSRVAWS